MIDPRNELDCAFAENPDWRPWIGYSFGRPERIYFPNNGPRKNDPHEPLARRRDLARLRRIVADAEARGKQVHAVGSGWSFSSVTFTPGYLVASRDLNEILPIEQLHIPASIRDMAVFAHGGCTLERVIHHIDHPAARPRRALQTFAGSRGMTLAGVLSTGTHGSQVREPLLGDAMLALMVVAEGGKTYWIQRADGPVAPGDVPFDGFDGEVIADDEVMNAATLSLGCFGIIYAVLLSVKPMYWWEASRAEHIVGRDFEWFAPGPELGRALDDPEVQFLEVVLNPFATRRTARGERGHTVRVTTCRAAEPLGDVPEELSFWGAGRGSTSSDVPLRSTLRLVRAMGSGWVRSRVAPSTLPAVIPHAVDAFIDNLRSVEPSRWVSRCHDFIGGYLPLRIASCEVAFPRARTPTMLAAIARWAERSCQGPRPFALPGAVSLRYTLRSSATLSIFGDRAGEVYDTGAEICALQPIYGRERTREGLLECVDELVALGATPHWGQLHRPSRATTHARFGERVESWRRAYRRLNPTGRTFGSEFARAAGLFD